MVCANVLSPTDAASQEAVMGSAQLVVVARARASCDSAVQHCLEFVVSDHQYFSCSCIKNNQSTPRPSDHPPVMGETMSKRLGGIKGCKYKTSSWHSNRFPDADNIGSTV